MGEREERKISSNYWLTVPEMPGLVQVKTRDPTLHAASLDGKQSQDSSSNSTISDVSRSRRTITAVPNVSFKYLSFNKRR